MLHALQALQSLVEAARRRNALDHMILDLPGQRPSLSGRAGWALSKDDEDLTPKLRMLLNAAYDGERELALVHVLGEALLGRVGTEVQIVIVNLVEDYNLYYAVHCTNEYELYNMMVGIRCVFPLRYWF